MCSSFWEGLLLSRQLAILFGVIRYRKKNFNGLILLWCIETKLKGDSELVF